MTKIMVVDGQPECPNCGAHLYANFTVTAGAYLEWDRDEECWTEGLRCFEAVGPIQEVYCDNCRFILRGDAIHSVEVEVEGS